jgi:hypothetical protein
MVTKQERSGTGLTDRTAQKTASTKAKTAAPRGSGESTALVRSFAIRSDQFENLTALSAYNKLKRIQPDSVSAIVREAIDHYLERADDTFREFMPKGDDEARQKQ